MANRRDILVQAGAAGITAALGAPAFAKSASQPLRVVDAQVHLWRNAQPIGLHRKVPTFWAEDLLAEMKPAGVDAVVVCPPAFSPESIPFYDEVIRRYPDKFARWGYFPVDAPDREEKIKTWRNPPYELGLRYTFLTPTTQAHWTDGSMDWLWPAAHKYGVPLGFGAQGPQLDTIAQQAERYPGLKVMVDHMAVDGTKKGAEAYWNLPKLLAMAKYPGIVVKTTSMPTVSAEAYPYRDTHDAVKRCLDAFGPERVIWGSDMTRLPCTYRQAVTMFTEEMPWLKGEDQRLVMGESLMRWIGWRPKGWTA